MKKNLLNELRYKFSTDNFSKQKAKIENFLDENSHYNQALHMDSLTDANSQRLEYELGDIIHDSITYYTIFLGSSIYDKSDKKLSWKKICDIASSYRKIISKQEKKLDTSYKASVLMASIIQNNIVEDEDKKIRLALDSALYYMCSYSVEYNSLIPKVQKKILYDYNIPDIENILKYIKTLLNEGNIIYEKGYCITHEISTELVAKFEPLLRYIHKYLILQDENEKVIHNIYEAANKYDKMFKEDETEEKNEIETSNKGISKIFKRKKKVNKKGE